MIEAEAIDAASTIKLLAGIETLYSATALIHVFLDNARYHHAKIVRKWLSQPGRRIALHFVPSYCPHLNPIERLWALMHQHLTHNKTYPTCREFANAILNFLRDEVPRKWGEFCDSVTDTIFGSWRERGNTKKLGRHEDKNCQNESSARGTPARHCGDGF
jgi:hypothetical protein